MTPLESLAFLIAAMGNVLYLNAMTACAWHQRLARAAMAGGCGGLAFEPLWPTVQTGSKLILAVGMALYAWPLVVLHFKSKAVGATPAIAPDR